MKREVFLEEKPLEEAQTGYLRFLRDLGILAPGPMETVPVKESCGRVTAAPVFAVISHPHFHAAAMDGFAVRARRTFGATEQSPLRLQVGEEAFPVDTGDVLPEGCDAVIMVEDTHETEPGVIEITAAVFPYQHVRVMGEDVVATEMLLPANHLIRPVDVGAMLAGGVGTVPVHPRPRVAVIPTGTEVVEPGTPLKPGDIIEFNTPVLGEMVREWGGIPVRYGIVPDDFPALKAAVLRAAAECDVVLLNAGASAGREDFTAAVVRECGSLFAHGVAIKPGKPVVLGAVNRKPFLGIPGYPVSAVLNAELFARPVILAKQGRTVPEREKVNAFLSRRIVSPAGVEEFVRVKLGRIGAKIVATPLGRGAGRLLTLVRADGILRVPRFSEGFEAGSVVPVELLRSRAEIEETIVVIGSHDLALDIIANYLRLRFPEATLSSAHVGSLGGLLALKRGEAHLAGTHLLDEATGEYNVSYVRQYLTGVPAVLVNLSYREQGFIVAPGNPKRINTFNDLVRDDIRFVNRQRGAGTRVLLDFHLRRLGLAPERVTGYQREEYTHLAVAAAVAGGTADVGLGIRAAATALGLDFVPVADERYDLCVLKEYWEGKVGERLRAVLADPEFQAAVLTRGGYDLRDCGRVVYEQG
ncbi:MAG: molybdopterin biosynthesis protein [Bacillota bacterium]|nr:molybdopterin biosynthesis protein [Thermoanaerobacteraceae bacterium]